MTLIGLPLAAADASDSMQENIADERRQRVRGRKKEEKKASVSIFIDRSDRSACSFTVN